MIFSSVFKKKERKRKQQNEALYLHQTCIVAVNQRQLI